MEVYLLHDLYKDEIMMLRSMVKWQAQVPSLFFFFIEEKIRLDGIQYLYIYYNY